MDQQQKQRRGWYKWRDLTPDEQQQVLLRFAQFVDPTNYGYWVDQGERGHTAVLLRRLVSQIRNWDAQTPFED